MQEHELETLAAASLLSNVPHAKIQPGDIFLAIYVVKQIRQAVLTIWAKEIKEEELQKKWPT